MARMYVRYDVPGNETAFALAFLSVIADNGVSSSHAINAAHEHALGYRDEQQHRLDDNKILGDCINFDFYGHADSSIQSEHERVLRNLQPQLIDAVHETSSVMQRLPTSSTGQVCGLHGGSLRPDSRGN
jgi:hypothetical protein